MRRANSDTTEQSGQDSFLDIVANIVGILILLVMVMGLRASYYAGSEETTERDATAAALTPVSDEQLQSAVHAAASREADLRELVARVVQVRQETRLRDEERMGLTTFVTAAEQELDQLRSQLDDQQRQDFDLRRQLADARATLDDLTRQKVSLLARTPDVEEIECLPTPLAETVNGNELHLRLAHGHVAAIPLDELRTEFQKQAERDVWRLRDQNSLVGTVGPIDGFRLRYRLAKGRVTVHQQPGFDQQATVVRFIGWQLLPVSTQLGEPTDQAMLPNSDLRQALKKLSPESTTVTIWTYPGSFDDYRKLRRALFEWGYASAGRPLPEGVPIGGSPAGTKSAAQ